MTHDDRNDNLRISAAATAGLPAKSQSRFSYTSLDLAERSIRLVRIRPELSLKGQIQCELRHATIDSEYICLSYVWGQPDEGHHIIIDGKTYTVRNNLFNFLRFARKRDRLGWLWIDALCIDQSNLAERTHQVQQMGLIFSQATEVVSWLGRSPETVDFLQKVSGNQVPPQLATKFVQLEYWRRAWVTQEVLLARQVTLMAGASELPMEDLPGYVKDMGSDHIMQVSDSGQASPHTTDDVRGRSLIYLLHRFKDQQCELLRDRVFSLLALCGDGSNLQVDYKIPHQELAFNIFICCQQSFCLCTIHVVCRTLSLGPYERFGTSAFGPSTLFLSHTAKLELPMKLDSGLRWHCTWERRYKDLNIQDYICNIVYLCGEHTEQPYFFLIIDLELVCSNTARQLAVHVDLTKDGFTYLVRQLPGTIRWDGPFTWPERLIASISRDRKKCTFQFPLGFLVQLTSMYERIHKWWGYCGHGLTIRMHEDSPKFSLKLCI
jgi:hypothetical protein